MKRKLSASAIIRRLASFGRRQQAEPTKPAPAAIRIGYGRDHDGTHVTLRVEAADGRTLDDFCFDPEIASEMAGEILAACGKAAALLASTDMQAGRLFEAITGVTPAVALADGEDPFADLPVPRCLTFDPPTIDVPEAQADPSAWNRRN